MRHKLDLPGGSGAERSVHAGPAPGPQAHGRRHARDPEIHFDDSLLQAVRADLGERCTVELVATVAGYNLVSRFLKALQIHSHDER